MRKGKHHYRSYTSYTIISIIKSMENFVNKFDNLNEMFKFLEVPKVTKVCLVMQCLHLTYIHHVCMYITPPTKFQGQSHMASLTKFPHIFKEEIVLILQIQREI